MRSKIGVYICQCGSNISDYVDVEKVKEVISHEEGVYLAKVTMFACADSTQKEMEDDIQKNQLDGLVVASCSPKLHLFTFRAVAVRAGLNPYNYVQVNIREQGSWAHSDNPTLATDKAIRLIKAGITRVKFSEPMEPLKIPAQNVIAVIGAGIAGMRAAIELADMGSLVYLIEKDHFIGGRVAQWDQLYPTDETGEQMVSDLFGKIKSHSNITLFTGVDLTEKTGSVGSLELTLKITPRYIIKDTHCDKLKRAMEVCPVEVDDEFNVGLTKRKAIYKNYENAFPDVPAIDMNACTRCGECEKICENIDFEQPIETLKIQVGTVILATGFDPYEPEEGEYGYKKIKNVITLPQFKRLIALSHEKLLLGTKEIRSIAYIYCVGSRESEGDHKYCSRYCCASAIHTSIQVKNAFKNIHNFHLNRGIRTYGKQEIMYHQSSEKGDIYFQFSEDDIPEVRETNGNAMVKINDILTGGKELEMNVDLVVLVTGMVPRKDNRIGAIMKVPLGRDMFFNEIHPKLRPVETVIEGIHIAGACQSPKNISESVKSSLSSVAKAYALVNKGEIEVEPILAKINEEACVGCDECIITCPFDAIDKVTLNGKHIARVNEASCKGCGMCGPVCPEDAIELTGYTNNEIESTIKAMVS